MSLRKKIADSAWFNSAVESFFAAYLRFAFRTSKWDRSGFEAMNAVLEQGEPVIMVLWHQRLIMAPYLFDTSAGKICSLTSSGRAGRLAGNILTHFDFDTIAMSSHARHVAASRQILGRIRQGCSIGIAADGPRGPARVSSNVPLIWARASGCRVFAVTFSANKVLELPTWDRMWLPRPWSRGVLSCREWEQAVPRNVSTEDSEILRLNLQAFLDDLADAADRAAGRAPRGVTASSG